MVDGKAGATFFFVAVESDLAGLSRVATLLSAQSTQEVNMQGKMGHPVAI